MDARKAVVEDVLRRIAEEHGVQAMGLDWSILESVCEETNREKFSKAAVSKPHGLRKRLEGVGLAQDEKGFYVRTHRARSKSYSEPSEIPLSAIKFIRSTG